MNRLTKSCVLAATLVTMALSPLAQASAAGLSVGAPNYTYGLSPETYGGTYGDVEQVRHKGRHHYNRHRHYRGHRQHRSNRYCRYSPRRGTMVCRPHNRYR